MRAFLFLLTFGLLLSPGQAVDLFSSGHAATSRFAEPEITTVQGLPRPGSVDHFVLGHVDGYYWAHAWGRDLYRSADGGPQWEKITIPEFAGFAVAVGGNEEGGLLLGNQRALRLRQGQLIAENGAVRLTGAPVRDGVEEYLLVNRNSNRLYPWQDGWLLTDGGQTYFSPDGLNWTPGRWQALLEAEFGARIINLHPIADQLLAFTENGNLYHSIDGHAWAPFPGFPSGKVPTVNYAGAAAGQGRLVVFLSSADGAAESLILIYQPGPGWKEVRFANAFATPMVIDYHGGHFGLVVSGFEDMNDFRDPVSLDEDEIFEYVPVCQYLYLSPDGRNWKERGTIRDNLQYAYGIAFTRRQNGLPPLPFHSFTGGPRGWKAKPNQVGSIRWTDPGSPETGGVPRLPQPVTTRTAPTAPEIHLQPGHAGSAEAGNLQDAARAGDTTAMLKLALSLVPDYIAPGERFSRFVHNPVEAERLARQALAAGNDEAAALLSRLLQGWMPTRRAEAVPALEPYAGRSPRIAYELGLVRMHYDPEAGLKLLQQAMDEDPDFEAARHAFRFFTFQPAADRGDPDALYTLSQALEFDQEVKRLPVRIRNAEQLLREAASAGHHQALEDIAAKMESYTLQNANPYVPILSQQADQGNPVALRVRGRFRLAGNLPLISKNETAGIEDLRRAADGGDALAMTYLGQLYSTGSHVPIDVEKAIAWLEKSIAAGLEEEEARLKPLLQRQARANGHRLPLDGRVQGVSPGVFDALGHAQRNQRFSDDTLKALFQRVWADGHYGALEEDLARELLNLQPGGQVAITDTGGRTLNLTIPVPNSFRPTFSRLFPEMMPVDDLNYFSLAIEYAHTAGALVFFIRETAEDDENRKVIDYWLKNNADAQIRIHQTAFARLLDYLLQLAQPLEPEAAAEYRAYLKTRLTALLKDHPKANELVPVARQRELYGEEFMTREENWKQRLESGDQPVAAMLADWRKSEALAREVRDVLQKHFLEFWQQSSVQNAYKPFLDEVSRRYAEINALPEGDRADARRMLFRSLAAADALVNRTGSDIPDFLYAWINPDAEN